MSDRKAFLLRLDPALHDALQRWAGAEFRSLNAQIEFLLRRAAESAGRFTANRDPETPAEG
ncbi:MAG: hypothetical protein HOP28_07620 [Gemmatimonadales bacterium]|nr:hypothetical protein [Gemmatimonadales bacterium]